MKMHESQGGRARMSADPERKAGAGNTAASLGKMSPSAQVNASCGVAATLLIDVVSQLALLEAVLRARSSHQARISAHEVRRRLESVRRELEHANRLVANGEDHAKLAALHAQLTAVTAQARPLLAHAPKPAAHTPASQVLIAHGPDSSARFADRGGAATIDPDPATEWEEDRATLDIHENPAPHHVASLDPDPASEWEENRATLDISERPVQRLAASDPSTDHIQHTASIGVSGAGGTLPHLDAIQRSFGGHDVSGVRAHVGGDAAAAATAIGAEAYATGDHVAFAREPDLHTAAHEAAHVVQQRGGVQLKGGIGEVGDTYEQHADAVAERVVRGESAADILGGGRAGATSAVQCKKKTSHAEPPPAEDGVEQAITRARGALETVEKVLDTLDQDPSNSALIDPLWQLLPAAQHAVEAAHTAFAAEQGITAGAGLSGIAIPSTDPNKLAVELAGLEWRQLQLELRAKRYPPRNAQPVDTIETSYDDGPWGLQELVVHQTVGDPDPNRYERVVSQGPPGSSRVDLDIGVRDPSTRLDPKTEPNPAPAVDPNDPKQLVQVTDNDVAAPPKPETDEDNAEKNTLYLSTIPQVLGGVFRLMRDGVSAACRGIDTAMKAEKDRGDVGGSKFDTLMEIAYETALATSAVGVAGIVTARLHHNQIVHEALLEGVKELILSSIRTGARGEAESDGDLLVQFENILNKKLDISETAFQDAYGRHVAPLFRKLPLDAVQRIEARCNLAGQDPEIADLQEKNTAVQWVNAVARSHHGAMSWDPWANGLYGDDRGFPSDKPMPRPQNTDEAASVSSGNVDASQLGDWLARTQRPMVGNAHGVLEIFLWHNEDGSWARFTKFSDNGLRIDNIDNYTRGMIRGLGTVGAVHINKLIHVYAKYGEGADLDPPKDLFSFVITSDGYIRNWGENATPESMRDAAAFANSLSLSLL